MSMCERIVVDGGATSEPCGKRAIHMVVMSKDEQVCFCDKHWEELKEERDRR
jgi:hypothetical protein